MQHKNIVRMNSAEEDAILEHGESGYQTRVNYIASKLYEKGELFYFLANKDGLPTNICRFYGM